MHELTVFCKLNRIHVAYFTIGLDLAFFTVQHPVNMDSFDFKNVPLDKKSAESCCLYLWLYTASEEIMQI